MFRYIFIFAVINTSYRSLCVPVNPPPNIARSLTALADHCENSFLSTQIKDIVESCAEPSSPHGEKQLQCLMFYDINMQLCSAVAANKIAIVDDYTTKTIKEEQDVNSMCSFAEHWVFSNLSQYTHYKQVVDKIFKSPVSCGKICGVEDFMSDDSNFFCKYFKWGSEMLNQVTGSSAFKVASDNLAETGNGAEKLVAEPNSDLQDVQINKNITTNEQKSTAVTSLQSTVKTEESKVETSPVTVNKEQQSQGQVPESPHVDTNTGIEDTGPMPDNAVNEPSKAPEDVPPKADPVKDDTDKVQSPLEEQNKGDNLKSYVEKELQAINSGKDPVLDGPQVKQPNNDIDDLDTEEGKDSMADSPDDEDDDGSLLSDMDTKPEIFKKPKNEDFYNSNPVASADMFQENDDHFFPFFLTAVILVVLVYVLYHNKNKVGKVFFGLILEGRSGRRRNSRGHAYRRLDTLEQAMSNKSAAPPSKIIY